MEFPEYFKNKKAIFNFHLHPGTISNHKLLVPMTDFVNDGDMTNNDNIVIKTDIDVEKNIKIVDLNIWKFFVDRYKGGPEIRKPYIEDKKLDKKQIDFIYQKV